MKNENVKTNDEKMYDIVVYFDNANNATLFFYNCTWAIDTETDIRRPMLLIKNMGEKVCVIPMTSILYYSFEESDDNKDSQKENSVDKGGKNA